MNTAENQKIVIVNKATTDKKHPYTPINIEVLKFEILFIMALFFIK